MNIIRQKPIFSFILIASLLISGCGGGSVSGGLSLVGDDNTGNNPGPISPSDLIPSNPPAPVITTAEATQNSVFLDWTDESPREFGFLIIRDGVQVGATDRNLSEWTDTSVLPATTYTYIVVAWNKEGSGASQEKQVTTPAIPIPKLVLPAGAQVRSLAADQVTGELYAVGEIAVSAPNNNLDNNGVLAKFNPDGTQACVNQFGTNTWDVVFDIAIYNGEVYVLWSDFNGAETVSVFNAACDEVRSLNISHLSPFHFAVDQSGIYFNNGAKIDFQGTVSWGFPFPWVNYSVEYVDIHDGTAYYVGQSWNPGEFIAEGYTSAVDTTTRVLIWTSRWGGQVTASGHKVITNGSGVYTFGEDLLVVRHDFAGNILWKYQDIVRTGVFSYIITDDTAVYAMGNLWNGVGLTKITNEGTVAWQTSVVGRALAIFNNVLFVADGSNVIRRYDALTGSALP